MGQLLHSTGEMVDESCGGDLRGEEQLLESKTYTGLYPGHAAEAMP